MVKLCLVLRLFILLVINLVKRNRLRDLALLYSSAATNASDATKTASKCSFVVVFNLETLLCAFFLLSKKK